MRDFSFCGLIRGPYHILWVNLRPYVISCIITRGGASSFFLTTSFFIKTVKSAVKFAKHQIVSIARRRAVDNLRRL